MSIYRSAAGEERIRAWCEDRLTDWSGSRELLPTSLGATHIASTGAAWDATTARSIETPLVWVPGTNFNAATSLELAELLGRRFRAHLVDLPGQPGLSSPDRVGRGRVRTYGRWLAEVIDQLDEEPVIVAACSLGAAIALAAEPSDRIRGVALIGPAGLCRIRLAPKLLVRSTRWMARPTIESASAVVEHMQHPTSRLDPALTEWMALVARHAWQAGAPGPVDAAQRRRWHGRALVATGEADPFFPASRLREPAAASLGAPVEVVPGAGHLLPEEQPGRVVELLDRFDGFLG